MPNNADSAKGVVTSIASICKETTKPAYKRVVYEAMKPDGQIPAYKWNFDITPDALCCYRMIHTLGRIYLSRPVELPSLAIVSKIRLLFCPKSK
jgi:hypothetical protein